MSSRLRAGVRVPAEVRDFSVLQIVRTGCRSHSASFIMGTLAVSLGVKRLEPDIDHQPLSNTEVKNDWSPTSSPVWHAQAQRLAFTRY